MADFFVEGGSSPWILWKVERNRVLWMGKRDGQWHDEFPEPSNSYAQVFDWLATNDRVKVTADEAQRIAARWNGQL